MEIVHYQIKNQKFKKGGAYENVKKKIANKKHTEEC